MKIFLTAVVLFIAAAAFQSFHGDDHKHIWVAVETETIPGQNNTSEWNTVDAIGRYQTVFPYGIHKGKELVCVICHKVIRQNIDYGAVPSNGKIVDSIGKYYSFTNPWIIHESSDHQSFDSLVSMATSGSTITIDTSKLSWKGTFLAGSATPLKTDSIILNYRQCAGTNDISGSSLCCC